MPTPDLLVPAAEAEFAVSSKWQQQSLSENMSKFILRGPPAAASQRCFPAHQSIGENLYYELNKRDENQIAIVDGDQVNTFKQIRDNIIKVALILRRFGIQKNDVVALVSSNCVGFLQIVAACFYIGAAVNLVNDAYGEKALIDIFEISKPKLVIASELTLETVKKVKQQSDFIEQILICSNDEHVFCNKELMWQSDNDIENFKPVPVNPKEQTAMILCSSGTTGLPKGVRLSHKNINVSLSAVGDPHMVGMENNETTIALLPFYHVFGFLTGFGGLLFGMKQILLPKFKPDLFLRIIQTHQVKKLFLVPPLINLLAKGSEVDHYDLSSVKHILCGGAPLGGEIESIVYKRLKVPVRQLFGLTETTGCVSVIPNGPNSKRSGSVGKLIFGWEAKVESLESRSSLGPNEVGELCLKSEMNMLEYIDNPVATANAFDSNGYFLTGDLCYYDTDGYLYVVDRVKEMIKYKGYQVAPAELEALLNSHRDIKDSAVIGIPDERAGELSLAFVVKQPSATITEEEIKKFVTEHVPVHKSLHGGVNFVDEIPKSATGKILRKELKALYQ